MATVTPGAPATQGVPLVLAVITDHRDRLRLPPTTRWCCFVRRSFFRS